MVAHAGGLLVGAAPQSSDATGWTQNPGGQKGANVIRSSVRGRKMGLAASGTDVPLTRSFSSRQDRFQSGAACALDLRRLLLFLLRLLLIPRQARLGALLHPVRTQAKRVTKVYRITRSEALRVEPAREAEGIFLRENPDRTCVVGSERRKHAPL